MNIVKYDPFRELRNLQDDMTRLFTGVRPAGLGQEEMTHGAWAPSVDIFEDKDRLILEAELPGMKREDFEISVENNVITLSGERKFEKRTSRSTRRLRPASSMICLPTSRVNIESVRPCASAAGVKYWTSSLDTTGAASCVCTDWTFSFT